NLFRQNLQLRQQNGRLQGIQAAIHSHTNVVVASILTVAGNLPQNNRQFVVVCENSPAVAIAAKWFAGKETCAADGAQVAGLPALVAGAEALGSVFNYRDAVFLCNGIDGVKICTLAIKRDRDN